MIMEKKGGIPKNNKYLDELNKMLEKEVRVKDINGDEYTGILRGFYLQHLNVIIMTEKEKVLIRNWVSMKRTRGGK